MCSWFATGICSCSVALLRLFAAGIGDPKDTQIHNPSVEFNVNSRRVRFSVWGSIADVGRLLPIGDPMFERIEVRPTTDQPQERSVWKACIHFEAILRRTGMLANLEASGLVPTVENRNPFDPITQTSEHDRWWLDHPSERRQFRQSVEGRQKALRQIHAGVALGRKLSAR